MIKYWKVFFNKTKLLLFYFMKFFNNRFILLKIYFKTFIINGLDWKLIIIITNNKNIFFISNIR